RPGDVFIIKPVGSRAGCGAGIQIVELTADGLAAGLDDAERRRRDVAAAYGNAVLCRYVRAPMLWRGRKCHLRMYLLVRGPPLGGASEDCHLEFWRQGKILTALKPYACAAYDDAAVHDSHGDTTDRNLFFPADLRDCHAACVDACSPPTPDMLALEPDILAQIDAFVPHLKAVLVGGMRSRRTGAPLWTYPESNFAYEVFGCDFLVDTAHWQADATVTVRLLEINDKVGFAPVFGPPDAFPRPWPPVEGPDSPRWDLRPFEHSSPAFYQTMTDYIDFSDRFWRWLIPAAVLPFYAQFTDEAPSKRARSD
ncbi:MAG: hypothetical protein C0522_15045, partial [Rhodocyclaceae bacterium]|nr:hypothetical protein [Rhodocyclaceae bacterium]